MLGASLTESLNFPAAVYIHTHSVEKMKEAPEKLRDDGFTLDHRRAD